MSAEIDRDKQISIFVADVLDGVGAVSRALDSTEGVLPSPPKIQEHCITAHRLRGLAVLYGYGGVAALSDRLEALCERTANIPADVWPMVVGVMRETVQGIQTLVNAIRGGEEEDRTTVDRCLALSEQWVAGEAVSEVLGLLSLESSVPASGGEPTTDLELGFPEVSSSFFPEAEEYLSAIDGLTQVLRTNRNDANAAHRLLRALGTLKQSAYAVGFRMIGDIAHTMETCMAALRDSRISLTDELLYRLAEGVSHIRTVMRRDVSAADQVQREVSEFLSLLNGVCDAQVQGPLAGSLPSPVSLQDRAVGAAFLESATVVAAGQGYSAILPDEYFLPQLDPEILSYFVREAQEYLEVLEDDLLQLDSDPENKDLILQLFRTAHTLKGSAYTVGFQAIGDLVHHVEDFMGAVRDQLLYLLPGHTDSIFRAIDVLRVLLQQDPNAVRETRKGFQAALMELKRIALGHEPDVSETNGTVGECVLRAKPQARQREALTSDHTRPGGMRDKQEVIRVSRERLEQLMSLAGELVIGRGRLEQQLLGLEGLSEHVVACKTRLVDAVQSFTDKQMVILRAASSDQRMQTTYRRRGLNDFGTSELGTHDDCNALARRIDDVSADLTISMAELSRSVRHAHDDMSQLRHVTQHIRDELVQARMIPIGTSFTRFRRAIRDAAHTLHKEVALVTSGEHTQVDTGVVERLMDPLVHLVRNAVYHGIELPADRVAKGKSATGTVYLHAVHRGNSIIVEVGDDGAGLNLKKIRERAVTIGVAQHEQAGKMTDAEALQFIFAPGLSTADTVSPQAGRGVGLDVVKQIVEGMNGHIEVESLPDVGTKFTLHLPLMERPSAYEVNTPRGDDGQRGGNTASAGG